LAVTVENAIIRIKNNGATPLFVNANNADDYCKIRRALLTFPTLKLSSYFQDTMTLPDVDKMMADIKSSSGNHLILGLTEYLAFKDADSLRQIISDLGKHNRRITVLSSHLDVFLEDYIRTDIRFKDRVLLTNGVQGTQPVLTLTTFTNQPSMSFKSLKDWIASIEDNGCQSSMVISSLSQKVFERGYWSVKTITSVYDALCLQITSFAESFQQDFGTEEQWKILYDELVGNKPVSFVSLKNFGVKEPERAIVGYQAMSDDNKWLLHYLLKSSMGENYAVLAAKAANKPAEMVRQIYCYLLELSKDDVLFPQFYRERRELIEKIADDTEMQLYLNLADVKLQDKIYYLTDLTELERKEAIKCIAKFDYSKEELRSNLSRSYPFLADYLSPYFFGKPFLDEYFERYKEQKLKNIIDEDFVELVNNLASEKPRKFIVELPTRSMVLSKDSTDYSIIWIDALGVEFLGFICKRCDALGLKADIEIARAEMPTLTGYNKEFFDETRGDKKVSELDKLKHSGEGDYDYSKTQLPLYIVRELEIIDEALKKAKSQISKEQKPVMIISDHGASRLTRIYEHIITVDAEVDGKHGGRCCVWKEGLSDVSPYASDNEIGYCVLANYDRFEGGKYTGVELHGGATLEEVVVPIIKLSLKNATVTFKLNKKQFPINRGKAEEVIVTLSAPVEKLRLKIRDKHYIPVQKDNTTYTFETDIDKPGTYQAVLLDDNQVISSDVKLEFKSAIGGINEIL
jgi:hypothetical protein